MTVYLTEKEAEFVRLHSGASPDELLNDRTARKALFESLWAGNAPCRTCGAREGHCAITQCIRLRVTERLRLSRYDQPYAEVQI